MDEQLDDIDRLAVEVMTMIITPQQCREKIQALLATEYDRGKVAGAIESISNIQAEVSLDNREAFNAIIKERERVELKSKGESSHVDL